MLNNGAAVKIVGDCGGSRPELYRPAFNESHQGQTPLKRS